MSDAKKCQNPACTCTPPKGDRFCGAHCEALKEAVEVGMPMRPCILRRRRIVTRNLGGNRRRLKIERMIMPRNGQ